jgi:HD superfamily phosphohydrolase
MRSKKSGALNHEEVARPLICGGEVEVILKRELGPGAPERIIAMIRGKSGSPLQGLISGSIDLDKLDYLRRDAFMCGVSYGEIDVDRLINALTLVRDPDTGQPRVGMIEKGLSALESLLFAKYQMYRNVYWHHAVRSATAMYKRVVADALDAGRAGRADARRIHGRRHSPRPRATRPESDRPSAAHATSLQRGVRVPGRLPRARSGRMDRLTTTR